MSELLWDPLNDLFSFRETMHKVGGGFYQPSVDVSEKADSFIVRVNLPGLDQKDVELHINENSLTVKGEIRNEDPPIKEHYLRRERRYGPFLRTIPFYTTVKSEQAKASLKNGVLMISVPKSEPSGLKGKKIEIQ